MILTPLLRTLLLLWESSRKWAIALGGLLLIRGGLPVLFIYLSKRLIDGIIQKENAQFLVILLMITGIINLISQFSQALEEWVSDAQALVVSDYTYDLIHQKSVEVDLEDYENPDYYNKFQRAIQEAAYRPTKVVKSLALLGQNTLSFLAFCGLLLSLQGGIAFVLVLAILPNSWLRLRVSRQMHRWQYKNILKERLANYYHWILTHDWLAKEIRLFELGSLFITRFHRLRSQLRREKLQVATRYIVWDFFSQMCATGAVFGSYGLIVYQTVKGEISVGSLVMYYQAFGGLQKTFQGVLSSLTELYNDNLFLANLYEFLDLKPKQVNPIFPAFFPCPIRQGIVFEKISYNYSNSPRQALKEINLTIRPGEVIALVGENGSGKTTLTKLLSRLYDPTEGRITIDGIDLRQFDLANLRRQISVIFQDYGKYNLSVKENIGLGNLEQGLASTEISTSAKEAGADEFIHRLPQEYETLLGNLFEGGEELSIGQWQKIALARALFRNSQIIILDEPTSALDPKAESAFFEKFRQLLKNQMAILISHRLSTVRMADCIYVLDQGAIVEKGNHEHLIQQGGIYSHLFDLQSRHYL
ncbi:ABC transporter ATP-binding protein [Crocosphaera sp. XPORK-15E]|uniref:ABC transporter ATP-binding protein n=1 Tax=Crocosphaera sp. XPORK-15E TaxID=3110247 RepID=UPI002B218814|nr:ABC transporter ATP-binding protein [Crocosphaera sp. XPORK-15E]MEA5536902.1 ABC transporter ATP-binding protein [Crocosphaera sp. XPORK-15E]